MQTTKHWYTYKWGVIALFVNVQNIFGGRHMKCPYCGYVDSKVIDSRSADEGSTIRRRRECMMCNRRFTSYEKIEHIPLMVVKKDKSREPFDTDKIRKGLIHACQKRPISMAEIENMVSQVERFALSSRDDEINSRAIGESVMDVLRKRDEVAYVRFASVYRQFTDVGSFMDALTQLIDDGKKRIK